MLLNYHIGCIVCGLPCVEVRVRFGWVVSGLPAEAQQSCASAGSV